MSKLGYTWYPENWWTSEEFFDLEDKPMVRYAYREVIDLIYTKNGVATITSKVIKQRFRIELSDDEFITLKGLFITDGDLWSHYKISKRLSRAETARINGKKGGRPPKEKDNVTVTLRSHENNAAEDNRIEEVEKKRKDSKAKPESVQEVIDFFFEKTKDKKFSKDQGDKFFNFYSSKGWLVGKVKMKCWKSAASGTWMKDYKSKRVMSNVAPINGGF